MAIDWIKESVQDKEGTSHVVLIPPSVKKDYETSLKRAADMSSNEHSYYLGKSIALVDTVAGFNEVPWYVAQIALNRGN